MQSVFTASDSNGDGMLSRAEFADCLERVRLGPTRLSKREIRYFQASPLLPRPHPPSLCPLVACLPGLSTQPRESSTQSHQRMAPFSPVGMRQGAGSRRRVPLSPLPRALPPFLGAQAAVDLDSEGRVSYEAFVPIMWDLLVETLKSNLLASSQGAMFDYLRCVALAAG